MGRRRADRATELPLQRLDKRRAGLRQRPKQPLALRLALEKRARLIPPKDPLGHNHQVFALRHRPCPAARPCGMVKDIHKLRALQAFHRAGEGDHRHRHKSGGVE